MPAILLRIPLLLQSSPPRRPPWLLAGEIHIMYMGEISQGVQSLNLMSYLSGVLGPFFGDLGLCYGKN